MYSVVCTVYTVLFKEAKLQYAVYGLLKVVNVITNATYLDQVNLLEREFLCFGGDQEWLEGLKNAPKKLQNLATVNNILCHKPWAITSQHMQVRLR